MAHRSATILYLDTGPWFGGAQRSLVTLINALDWDRWHPLVVGADNSGAGLLHECGMHRIPCQHVPFRHWPRRPIGVPSFVRDVVRLRFAHRHLRSEQRIDLVHANSARAGLLAAFGLPRSLPLVLHDRDVLMPGVARRILARRAARVIAISKTVAATWCCTPAARVEVVPNGFDVGALAAVTPSSRLAFLGGTFTVVQVADLTRWKRHRLFLEAMGLLCERVPGARAVVLGRPLNGEGETYLAELRRWVASKGLQDCIEFVTDCENAVPWIVAADAMVSASENEPFGRSVVEALGVGTPVVVTGGGGPEEIVEGAGCAARVVPPTATAIAEALNEWRCPVNRMAVYWDATRCARQYEIQRIAPRVTDIYGRVLDEVEER